MTIQSAMRPLPRDIDAITVPNGKKVTLKEGEKVRVVQELGGSFTVKTDYGNLMRIDGMDADALGRELPEELAAKIARDAERAKGSFSMDYVSEALEEVYDPEIPVSIVELGLVYRTEEVMLDDGRRRIEIDMTMTAPGCGMGDVLTADAKRAAEAVPGVDEAEVQMVFSPPWGAHMMSDAVKLQLGLL